MKNRKNNLFIIGLLTLLLIIFQFFINAEWWWFVIPVFVAGVLLPPKFTKGNGFCVGFVAGALSWFLPHFYFQWTYSGKLFAQLATLIGVPVWVLVIAIAVIGGILGGLAFTTGKQLRSGKEKLKLNLEE